MTGFLANYSTNINIIPNVQKLIMFPVNIIPDVQKLIVQYYSIDNSENTFNNLLDNVDKIVDKKYLIRFDISTSKLHSVKTWQLQIGDLTRMPLKPGEWSEEGSEYRSYNNQLYCSHSWIVRSAVTKESIVSAISEPDVIGVSIYISWDNNYNGFPECMNLPGLFALFSDQFVYYPQDNKLTFIFNQGTKIEEMSYF